MKKLLFVFLFAFLIIGTAQARTVYSGTNLDFDLVTWQMTHASNTYSVGFGVVNYCTFTANISDLRIIGYFRSTTRTASGWAYQSSGNQGNVYNASDGWVRGVTSSWTATFSDGTEQNCGTSGGVDHYAKTTVTVQYGGTEVVEGNGYYFKTSSGTNSFVQLRYSDWSSIYPYDDYSSQSDTNLSTYPSTGYSVNGWKYYRLEYSPDGGSTWIPICESTDSSGTTDPDSGVYPCDGAICEAGAETETITPTITETITPTVTPTVTPTITETITPTVTPTITETITPTVTPTITETITPTVTPTVTQTATATITQTHTITPTITPTVTQTATATITQTHTITPTLTPFIDKCEAETVYTTENPLVIYYHADSPIAYSEITGVAGTLVGVYNLGNPYTGKIILYDAIDFTHKTCIYEAGLNAVLLDRPQPIMPIVRYTATGGEMFAGYPVENKLAIQVQNQINLLILYSPK